MPYFENKFISFGHEVEFANDRNGPCHSITTWRGILSNAGFNWVNVKYEATAGVDAEIVIPPFSPYSDQAKRDIASLFDFITANGGKVGTVGCGGHVHVGNAGWDATQWTYDTHWEASKSAMANGRYLINNNDAMPLALVKDVITRYGQHQDEINAIVSRSRRQNRFCRPINSYVASMQWERADTISAMNSVLGGKFSAVSVDTWSRIGTIEFRQHQATLDSTKLFNWCRLIANMFHYSDAYRIDHGGSTIEHLTPENPYRRGSRIGVMWAMMRQSGGSTTSDIMSATGWTADTVRARISEMRRDHGDDAIICHTQQAYGHRYGASNGQHDLNGYEVAQTVSRQSNTATIRNDDDAGITSIWADLSDETYEYFNRRRQALS
jgi:hypothetical protein